MKTYLVAITVLTSLIGAAHAEIERPEGNRNHDLRDSDTYDGKYARNARVPAEESSPVYALESVGEGLSREEILQLREERRMQEKNNSGGGIGGGSR